MFTGYPEIIAHRGYSSRQRGNTRLAFQEAIESSAIGIELDIWRTKDDYLVINHDNTIDNGMSIKSYDYQMLSRNNCDLMCLSELIELVISQRNYFKLCIEVKGAYDDKTAKLLGKILGDYSDLLKTHNVDVYLMSFSHKYIHSFGKFMDLDRLVYLTMDDIIISDKFPYGIVCLEASVLTIEQMENISRAKKTLWVYGAYNKYNLDTARKLGAKCVIVNDIEFTEKHFMAQPSS
jgi:glycerophosphoryl diester phosphodiesterase